MKRVLLSAVALVALAGAAGAQTTATQGVGTEGNAPSAETAAGAEESLQVEIVTRARNATPLTPGVPVAVDLQLDKVPGADATLSQGVTAKAFIRFVEVGDRKIGQIMLTGVQKEERQEALTPENFVSQFDLKDSRLDQSPMTIRGDGPELVAALRRLAEAAQDEPLPGLEEKEKEVVEASDGGSGSVGGSGSQNSEASGFRSPGAVEFTPKEEPVESTRITTAGCDVRIDLAQNVAIQQSKVETLLDGAVSDTTECTDSQDRYPLEKSYSVCSDAIDLEGRTATAQYVRYYVDGGGKRQDVTDCEPDPEQQFTIYEKSESCPIFIDYQSRQAVPQAELVYIGRNNGETRVRSCNPSEEVAAVPLVETAGVCGIRHDYGAGVSYRQTANTYELNGAIFQADSCKDSEESFQHEPVYTDFSGNYICQPIIDEAGGTATLQSRAQITVDDNPQFITECKPDQGSTLAITATTEGCSDIASWPHDLAAGVTYGLERFFFSDNGKRTYITDCQVSDKSYEHQVATTGYQHHDDQRYSFPLQTVTINTEFGSHNVATSAVLPGTAQEPYVLDEVRDVPNGTSEYSGCDAFRQTDKMEIYDRPDGTEYQRRIGDGPVVGPSYACSAQGAAVWSYDGTNSTRRYKDNAVFLGYDDRLGNPIYSYDWHSERNCRYRGQRTLIREDGQTFTENSSSRNYQAFTATSSVSYPDYPSCPDTYSGSGVGGWNNAEGW